VRPRLHNVLSYSVTVLVFWGVLLWRERAAGWSLTADLGAALWTEHFVRRSLESAFVHRYSKSRVAAADYLTEYLYYWGFAGWIAWTLSAPGAAQPALLQRAAGLVLFAVAEACNARAHLQLRGLRSPGGSEKRIPRGVLFKRLSCPHYFFEILSWVGFNLALPSLPGIAFMALGAGILASWAHTRHVAYLREFDGQAGREAYPAERRALIPFLF
jgi:very-long-chain enoyl-CoA reductase